MSSNHFSYFRVKNFKRFKDLEVKDIGQFNLILGDNNVGKTSLLEALMFEENFDVFIYSLSKALYNRQMFGNKLTGGVWEFIVNKDELVNNDYAISTFYTSEIDSTKEFPFAFDRNTKELFLRNDVAQFDEFLNREKFEKSNWKINNPQSLGWPDGFVMPLISNIDGYEESLTDYYSKLINQGPRKSKLEFIDLLKSIDETLINIDYDTISISGNTLITLETDKSEGRILLPMQGNGFISLFRSLLFLLLLKNKKLLVDEIDAGIYYSRMKDYWKVILSSAFENNVQIFASTHNRECMQYYIEAIEELGLEFKEKSRAISLVENQKTKEINSVTFKFEEFEHGFIAGNEIR